jgi:hypothetical protein
MSRKSARSKTTSAGLAAVLLTSLLGVVATAGPAAATQYGSAPQTSLAYTDSVAPKQSFENPTSPLPLGSWVGTDAKTHVSRIYASYDLTALAGKDVLGATLDFAETQMTQCQARSVEVWQTKTPTYQVTWHHTPDDEALLGTVSMGAVPCPSSYLTLDLTSAIRDAVAKHRPNFSIALRLPAADEANVSLGRRLNNNGVLIGIHYNTPPTTPTQLFNDDRPCATSWPYPYLSTTTPQLLAMPHDVDPGDRPTNDFAVWPVSNPDNRTVFTTNQGQDGFENGTTVPTGVLANGVTYAWQVRADDGTDQSPWSEPCYFTVDSTRPNTPTVTATYPQNQFAPGGTPIVFTFSPNGSKNVAAYQYTWNTLSVIGTYIGPYGVPQWVDPFDQAGFVRADKNGSATVSLSPPGAGPSRLTVASYSRSYNQSFSYTTYTVFVSDTSPVVTVGSTPQYAKPFTLTFSPNPAVKAVDSYTYQVGYGAVQTVPAEPDGTASVTLTLTTSGMTQIFVRSHSVNGWTSSPNYYSVNIDTTPTISSDVYAESNSAGTNSNGGVGIPGTFTFKSKIAGAVSVTYSFDFNGETTIPLDANGTAQVQWAPDVNGQHTLYAYVTGPTGTVFDTYYYYFNVT